MTLESSYHDRCQRLAGELRVLLGAPRARFGRMLEDPAGGDRRGDGRAVPSAVQVGGHRAEQGGPLGAGLQRCPSAGLESAAAGTDDIVRLAVEEN